MNKTQIVICKCGVAMAAASEPFCYNDKDWLKDLKQWIKRGYKIDLIEKKDFPDNFGKCKCPKNIELF